MRTVKLYLRPEAKQGAISTFAHWIRETGQKPDRGEYSPRSPDLTPLDFFLWGILKHTVYATKPRKLNDMRAAVVTACESIPRESVSRVCRFLSQNCRLCIFLNGEHFKHLK